jgi:hypothetical protein
MRFAFFGWGTGAAATPTRKGFALRANPFRPPRKGEVEGAPYTDFLNC